MTSAKQQANDVATALSSTGNGESESSYDTLLARLSHHAQESPSKVAVTYLESGAAGGKEKVSLTYRQLDQQTTNLAQQLLLQINKKETTSQRPMAVLVYPPSLDFMVAFLACVKAGIVAVPVFPPNPTRKDTLAMFCKIVANCQATIALTNTSYNHMKKVASIQQVLQLKKQQAVSWPEQLRWITTDTLLDAPKEAVALPPIQANVTPSSSSIDTLDNVVFLQYTSGSTSDPKGVMITQTNLAHNLTIITNELQAHQDTVVVSWLPQYHDMGLIGSYLGLLYCGGTGYYLSPLTFLQRPMIWIEAVSKYRATHLQAPNFAFKLTARKCQASDYSYGNQNGNKVGLDLSSIRHIINAAEPVDQDSMDSFHKTFGPFGYNPKAMFPTYGLAEHTVFVCSGGKQRLDVWKKQLEVDATVVLATDKASPDTVSHLIGCGYPAHQKVDVKIVNTETQQAVPEDAVGEIWVNSPSKAAGYYGKVEETKEDFHAKLAASENGGVDSEYLRTGDLGFLHNGELFICGRLKDLIIVGGRNYYPQDIEATAESSSDLVRPGCSAAFTIDPTHEGGEEVALVMELKDVPAKSKVSDVCVPLAKQIRGAINQEHSLGISEIAFLKPRTVPKTSSGKIARSWCRKGFVGGTLEVVYRQSFKTGAVSLEVDGTETSSSKAVSASEASKIRNMSREDILTKLLTEVAQIASIPKDSIPKDTALVTILDSLTLSQLKGLLEHKYAVKISDEYLFQESTTLLKLVEVVKLGYAPDDTDTGGDAGSGAASAPSQNVQSQGKADGLAGALGCPPGVVCAIL